MANGVHGVVKVASTPVSVPSLLFATKVKWYVLRDAKPTMVTLTFCGPQPLFGERDTTLTLPYDASKPYLNVAVVAIPHGFTVPCKVALLAVTPTATPVVTTGFGVTGQTVGWTAGHRVTISGQTVGVSLPVHSVASFGQLVGLPPHWVLTAGQTVNGVFGHWVNPVG